MKEHRSIEKIIESLDKTKYPSLMFCHPFGLIFLVPDDWKFREARELFLRPDVQDPDTIEVCDCADASFSCSQLKWSPPDEEGLVEFMCKKNGFQFGVSFISFLLFIQGRTHPRRCVQA
jgi:flap endonuclease-1